jgi:hypothetical protein
MGGAMQLTITLTDEESRFLQHLQSLINGKKRFGQERCTLEDVIHECIKAVIYSGAKTTEDPVNENGRQF